MPAKTIILTGANSEIGKAAAKHLANAGHVVILACRSREKAEQVRHEIGKNTIAAELDLASRRSIHEFTDWAHRELNRIDGLINNAADFNLSETERELTSDGFERIWFTNHLAPVLLTDRLMDYIIASPQGRIINISSKGLLARPFQTVDTEDPTFGNRHFTPAAAYYQSKMAQSIYTVWLAQQLTGTMATANCIRVTNVKIDINRFPDLPQGLKNLYTLKALFSITPEKMAETYAAAVLDPGFRNISGALISHSGKQVPFPAYAKDPLCIERVMSLTYRQLGIAPAVTFTGADDQSAPTGFR
ncbi:SDR family NAD(P)-dependent oxidoreductase [Pontiella agarivorans]|uniref:SDR family NAD(P)-dependent oxidoreductase n=1 Tax=Pontiella agarivorans TaxID=3038953 RepID=A0ABU5MZH7_9BACT|nr:SDR family NAD(P)-dependent oxidoreductase [Pontiella agarivorans]MDZ8119601.1 SDR family NAD(P)-dependent oxidoreductase [Pontiella agarivorans]